MELFGPIFIIFLIGLAIWSIDCVVSKIKDFKIIDSSEEQVESYVVSKKYIPEYTTEHLPKYDSYMTIYEDFIYVAPQYNVELIVVNERLIFNNEHLFKSCKVGNIVDLVLEKKTYEQKSYFNSKKIQKIEIKSFKIKH